MAWNSGGREQRCCTRTHTLSAACSHVPSCSVRLGDRVSLTSRVLSEIVPGEYRERVHTNGQLGSREGERGRVSPFRDSSDRCLISPMPSTNTSDYSTLESSQVDPRISFYPLIARFPAPLVIGISFLLPSLPLFLPSIFSLDTQSTEFPIYIYIYIHVIMVGEKFY